MAQAVAALARRGGCRRPRPRCAHHRGGRARAATAARAAAEQRKEAAERAAAELEAALTSERAAARVARERKQERRRRRRRGLRGRAPPGVEHRDRAAARAEAERPARELDPRRARAGRQVEGGGGEPR
ncbi:MAG: hypothetical protein HS111_26415 [Kofleriaceae bacterium]|nr:hypothetical protein [Kofleriaceae bacterium]